MRLILAWATSYSFWKVGQYQRFAGMEGRRQGNCLFAGEHTQSARVGYADGAMTSGVREAKRLLAAPAVTLGRAT